MRYGSTVQAVHHILLSTCVYTDYAQVLSECHCDLIQRTNSSTCCYFKHTNSNQFEGAWGDAGPRHMPPPPLMQQHQQQQQHNNAQAAHHQFMMEQQRRQVCVQSKHTTYTTLCHRCTRHIAYCLCAHRRSKACASIYCIVWYSIAS
jgi:hypothetical protein